MKKHVLLLMVSLLFLTLPACSKKQSIDLAAVPFSDNFDRSDLGKNWSKTPGWQMRDGQVFTAGTRNEALWLNLALPDNSVIELDIRSESPAGDIKFEIYGDGEHHASGYILIFGGWNNSISTIARLDEHGSDRQELRQKGVVQMGQTYHMKVVRQDKVLKWYVDGQLLLDYYDAQPLRGSGHDRLAFNGWATNLYFDNLKIRPATAADK